MYFSNHDLEEYLKNHTTPVDDVLEELTRKTHLTTYNPRMLSGPIQGKFIEMLCHMIKPQRVLEIGTFTGYSTICMARAIPENAMIDTIEVNDELEDTIVEFFKKANVSQKINLIVGNALEIVDTLSHTYDLVFIDGEKSEYPQYLNAVLHKLNTGGFIIADNVLWNGKVFNPSNNDAQTNAIRQFNRMIQEDEKLENVLLPFRDGMMLIRKIY
ncbi:O-methyltransferase [Tenuifilum thalassicum]|uniref:O-methyltransferase n=1 Tax=Tenuifilum thalassicum TaxID=2590900 RepID=A0A7D4C7Q2_9BACT|nr:O-methyltransferase [Tenuifilum thalassicum]QKG79162.1 O-methyltransferase [Tenuifilum thalassicum]